MGHMKESGMAQQQAQSLDGRDYIALTRISNLADDTTADVGETCARVPAADLPFLLAMDPPAIRLATDEEKGGA